MLGPDHPPDRGPAAPHAAHRGAALFKPARLPRRGACRGRGRGRQLHCAAPVFRRGLKPHRHRQRAGQVPPQRPAPKRRGDELPALPGGGGPHRAEPGGKPGVEPGAPPAQCPAHQPGHHGPAAAPAAELHRGFGGGLWQRGGAGRSAGDRGKLPHRGFDPLGGGAPRFLALPQRRGAPGHRPHLQRAAAGKAPLQ